MRDRTESHVDEPVDIRPTLSLSEFGLWAFAIGLRVMNPSLYRCPKQKSSGGLRRLFPLSPVRPPALARFPVRSGLASVAPGSCFLSRRLPDYLRPSGRTSPRSAPLSGNLFAVRCAFVKNRFERFRTKGTKICHFKRSTKRKSLPLSRSFPPPPTGCSMLSGREEAKPWPTISASWDGFIGIPLTTFC